MPVIDDEGNLFGVVNVIDALAVLLVLAVVVAGVAFVGVLGEDGEEPDVDEPEPDPQYVTIDLGSQPNYVIDRVAEDDRLGVVDADDSVTITDVYVSSLAEEAESGHLTVRAEGDGLRVGTDVRLEGDEYAVEGTVTGVDHDDPALPVESTPLLLESTVDAETAAEIDVGDEIRHGAHALGTVATVSSYPIGDDERRVLVGVELSTLERAGAATVGGQPVTADAELAIHTAGYDLTGSVVETGTTEQPGEPTTTVAEVTLENVDPSVADRLEAGMTETERGETLATVQSVDSQPSEVVVESADGELRLQEHPRNVDLTLTVELQTRQTGTELRFNGESIREGETVALVFDSVTVQGEVTTLE